MNRLKKIVIFGIGLIGGSLALALRRAAVAERIVGVGRSPENLNRALSLGIIDEATRDVAAALQGADLALIAVPVAQTGKVMAQIEPHLGPDTVITDVGSTKQDVLAVAYAYLPKHLSRFVPAHPIAGAEQSGVAAASADLYLNRNVVVTPLPQTDPRAVQLVTEMWQAAGARVSCMTPERHDEVLATISHLPHVLAYALMDEVANRPDAEELMFYAGTGFRDFTRIAGSLPEMWRDICLANRETLLKQMQAYEAQLARMRKLLAEGDGPALERLFANARNARNRMVEGKT